MNTYLKYSLVIFTLVVFFTPLLYLKRASERLFEKYGKSLTFASYIVSAVLLATYITCGVLMFQVLNHIIKGGEEDGER